jgi:hypothetical protein
MITSINEYKLILEKGKNQKNKDLVLIDVDQKINGSEEYLKKIFKYCTKYNRVIQFFDKTKSDTPTYDFPNQIKELELPEVTNIDISDIDTLFYGEEKEKILLNFNDGLVSGIVNGILYKDLNECNWLYLGHSDAGDKWVVIEPETNLFLKALKKIERKVVLLGQLESIAIVQPILSAYGIGNESDSEFEISLNPTK